MRPKGITPNNLARISAGVTDLISHIAFHKGLLRIQSFDTRTGTGPVYSAQVVVDGASAMKYRLPMSFRDEEERSLTVGVMTEDPKVMSAMGRFFRTLFAMCFQANSEATIDTSRYVYDHQAVQHLRLKEPEGAKTQTLYVTLDSKPAVLLVMIPPETEFEMVEVTVSAPPTRDTSNYILPMRRVDAARSMCQTLIEKGHAGYNALVGLHYDIRARTLASMAKVAEAIPKKKAVRGVLATALALLKAGVTEADLEEALAEGDEGDEGEAEKTKVYKAVEASLSLFHPSPKATDDLMGLHGSRLMVECE